jgi:tetratricopeptide (TPR) repeat protein
MSYLLERMGDKEGALAAYQQGIRLYREAIVLYPRRTKLRFLLGKALARAGDRPGAIAEFTETLRLTPTYTGVYPFLASLHLEDGNPDAARPFAEMAVKVDPKFVPVWWYLGRARQGVGDLDGAIAAFQQGLNLHPKHLGCQKGLAAATKARAERDRVVAPPPRPVARP